MQSTSSMQLPRFWEPQTCMVHTYTQSHGYCCALATFFIVHVHHQCCRLAQPHEYIVQGRGGCCRISVHAKARKPCGRKPWEGPPCCATAQTPQVFGDIWWYLRSTTSIALNSLPVHNATKGSHKRMTHMPPPSCQIRAEGAPTTFISRWCSRHTRTQHKSWSCTRRSTPTTVPLAVSGIHVSSKSSTKQGVTECASQRQAAHTTPFTEKTQSPALY